MALLEDEKGFERDILNTEIGNRLVTCRTDILYATEERKGSFRLVKKEAAIYLL